MQRNVSIALSIIIIILEIIALSVCYNSFGINLAYYTIDSNIFLLISTILYLITINNVPKIVPSVLLHGKHWPHLDMLWHNEYYPLNLSSP